MNPGTSSHSALRPAHALLVALALSACGSDDNPPTPPPPAADTTPPTVSTTIPARDATDVAHDATIRVTFNEAMSASSVDAGSITVGGLTGTVTYDAASRTATFTPSQALAESRVYTATVTTAVKDAAGNALASTHSWSFTTRAAAQPRAWGRAVQIDDSSANDAEEQEPQIATDGAGNAIAVWHQSDGARNSIWANRYTAGSGWGTPAMIESDDTKDAYLPRIAIDATGSALVVWEQYDNDDPDTQASIWANRYTAGSGWGTATLIGSDDAIIASGPRIAVDGAGNALAVWSQSDRTRTNIWANRYTAGSGWGAATLIESDDTGDAYDPQIASDDAGNAIAVWGQFDGTHYDIRANRYTAGSGWGTATLIESDAGQAARPQIAVDAAGTALAVWEQNDGSRHNIWANRYTVGSGWGMATLIESEDTGPATDPQIAVDAAGNAMAVWQQHDGTRRNIWANRYTAGSGWGTAALIESEDDGGASRPEIAIDAAGNAWAVWVQYDDPRYNIWANHYSLDR